MRKVIIVFVFSIFLSANLFAEVDQKQPDTVFQKVADYTKDGYKKDVEPIKKVSVFQLMADWVNGTKREKKSSPNDKPSLFCN